MSELIIEHPISIIEKLLKLGIGDEGRLLYLRKSLRNGKKIYESDKKFLKKMQMELENINSPKSSDFKNNFKFSKNENKKFSLLGGHEFFQQEKSTKKKTSEIDPGIEKIQNLIAELKKSDSKLMDNLEILLLSREVSSQPKIENPINSFSSTLKNHNADLFELLKNNPVTETKLPKIKKYDVMAAASAGLFTLWFASYQNLIDLGALEGLTLGLSAGAAVSCGIFFKQDKSKKSIF